MDWQIGLSVSTLVYLAFLFGVLGFLARDELLLRLLMLGASALYLVYYYHVTAAPLWDSVITTAVLGGVNLVMIAVVVLERTTLSMSADSTALLRHFPMLSPGQFRRLLNSARRVSATEPVVLTRENAPVDRLWYVYEGALRIDKAGRVSRVDNAMFVGELAFLTGAPASASVSVEAGARYLEWDAPALQALIGKSRGLQVALQAQFNSDLVRKVTASVPARVDA